MAWWRRIRKLLKSPAGGRTGTIEQAPDAGERLPAALAVTPDGRVRVVTLSRLERELLAEEDKRG